MKKKKKTFGNINTCSKCGKETAIFVVSQWFWGLFSKIYCIPCINKKFAKENDK